MSINKNFIVKNGLEVNQDLIYANSGSDKVGINTSVVNYTLDVNGTIRSSHLNVSGFGTFSGVDVTSLEVTSAEVTSANITNLNVGVSTESTTYVNGHLFVGSGSSTRTANQRFQVFSGAYVSGSAGIGTTNPTSKLHVVGDIFISGVSTFVGLSTFNNSVIIEDDLKVSGIVTANSISIGATQVISSARQLQNIASLDATTTATIESAIANAPNEFTDLKVTGISTLGITSATSLTAQTLNVSGISTFNNDIRVAQGYNAYFGNGNELGIIYNGSYASIQSTTNDLYISGTGADRAIFKHNGAVELYHSGSKKFETTGVGVTIYGTTQSQQLNVSGVSTLGTTNISGDLTFTSNNDLYLKDNGVINFGDSNDLQIYHNSSVSVISDGGTGGLLINSDNEIKLAKNGTGSDNLAIFTPDGSVELYYDGVKKFETTGIGVTIYGTTQSEQLYVSGIATATSFVKSGGTSSEFLKADGSVDSNTYLTTTGSGTLLTGIVTSIVAGTNVTISGSTGQVTINATGGGGGGESYWSSTTSGINTTSNVGIGTTDPTSKLYVEGDVFISGVSTANSFKKIGGLSSQFLKADGSVDTSSYLTTTGSGTLLTGIVTSITAGFGISVNQSTGNVTISATGQSGYWVAGVTGINTNSRVGIGSTNPQEALDVSGNVRASRFISTETSLAPFQVTSTTTVTNLSADLLDGKSAPSGDIVGTTDSQTLSNKTVNLSSNTLTGTRDQFNTALSDDNFATLSNNQIFTAQQTFRSVSAVRIETADTRDAIILSGRAGGINSYAVTLTPAPLSEDRTLTLPNANSTLVGADASQTLTNKTIAAGSNTITGLTNTNLSGSAGITNANLAHSTISGISLGGNLATLTFGTYITGTSYNGSTATTIGLNASSSDVSGNTVVVRSNGDFTGKTITATSLNTTNLSGTIGTITNLNVGILTASSGIGITVYIPASKLHVVGDTLVSGIVTASDFNSTSDINLKTNINTVENSIEIVNQLRGVKFDWKKDSKSSYGVIAQEVEKVLPELVTDTDPKTVNYNGLIGVLIEAVKELSDEVQELKSHLNK